MYLNMPVYLITIYVLSLHECRLTIVIVIINTYMLYLPVGRSVLEKYLSEVSEAGGREKIFFSTERPKR